MKWLLKKEAFYWYDKIKEYHLFIKGQKEVIKRNSDVIKKQRELIDVVPHQDLPPFHNKQRAFFFIVPNPKAFLEWWKKKFNPDSVAVVNFELVNGQHRSFLVREKKGNFKYKKKTYLFDNESKYFNIDFNMWCYDFHENLSLPIKRVFPVKDIRDTVSASHLSEDVEYAINPFNLGEALHSKLIEGIVRGAGLADEFKKLLLIGFITMVAVLIHLILYAYKSGMFQRIAGQ